MCGRCKRQPSTAELWDTCLSARVVWHPRFSTSWLEPWYDMRVMVMHAELSCHIHSKPVAADTYIPLWGPGHASACCSLQLE